MTVRPYFLLMFVLMGLVTYSSRIGLLGVARQMELHPLLRRALAYVPVAILAALVFPAVLAPEKQLAAPATNPYLWAAFATAGALFVTRRQWLAIVLGIVSLVAFRALLG
jgi:branched-subunit amino acid transport protein